MNKPIKYMREKVVFKNEHIINTLKSDFLEFLQEKGEQKRITETTLEVALMAVDDLISRAKEYQAVPSLKTNLASNRLKLIKERMKQLEDLKLQLNGEYNSLEDDGGIPKNLLTRDRVSILKTINIVENDLYKLKEKQMLLIANTCTNYGSFDNNGVFKDREDTYPMLIAQVYEIFKKIGFGHFTVERINESLNTEELTVASLFGGE